MKIDLYNQKGEVSGSLELPKAIFEVEYNGDLIHQALVRQLANNRSSIAHAKSKGEIRGGGKKPFAQKHTGNARQGSIRNPHMRGGGVTFGPRNVRNFDKLMPKKQRRQALFSALSEKARSKEIMGLEEFKMDKPKTKEFAILIKKLPIKKRVLILIPAKDEVIMKSTNNIANVKTVIANYVNIQDLQKHKNIIILKDAVKALEEAFLK